MDFSVLTELRWVHYDIVPDSLDNAMCVSVVYFIQLEDIKNILV